MHRWITALMMALLGAILFVAFVLQDIRIHPELAPGDLPWGLIIRYALAMTLGGALSGYLFAGLFGRGGLGGWLLAILSGVIATAIAGLFGSAFGLIPDMLTDGFSTAEIIQIAAGLLMLPLALIEQPWLALVVGAILIVTHLRCKISRAAPGTAG